jgi:hypothetical protein
MQQEVQKLAIDKMIEEPTLLMNRLNAAFAEFKELSEDDGLDERQEIESLKLTLQKNIKASGDALKTAKDSFYQQFRFHHPPVALNPQTLLEVTKNAQNSNPKLKFTQGSNPLEFWDISTLWNDWSHCLKCRLPILVWSWTEGVSINSIRHTLLFFWIWYNPPLERNCWRNWGSSCS